MSTGATPPRRRRWRRWLLIMGCASFVFLFAVWIAVVAVDYPLARLSRQRFTSMQVTDRQGTLLREFPGEMSRFGQWVSLKSIAKAMIDATRVSEDKRFFAHRGVDPWAVVRAARDNLWRRRIVSGASTITMQLVRLLNPRPRRLTSKVIEAIEALRIERKLSKREILEQYLNRAPYGHGTTGVEAASQLYFRKPASQLSIAESALLAVIPRAPRFFSPYKRKRELIARQQELLRRMAAAGVISVAQRDVALGQPLELQVWSTPFLSPHFTRFVRLQLAGKGSPQQVRTTLDAVLTRRIEGIVETHISRLESRDVSNAAVLVLDNRSGEVLAWVGSRKFTDRKNQGQVDGVTSLRQPGSTLKPFTYGLAFEKGYTASTIVADIETRFMMSDGRSFIPRNYDHRYYGPMRLRAALASSLNVSAMKVARWVGAGTLLTRLKALGFAHFDKPASFYGLGLTLGNGEVTLLELTAAFATLARGGRYLPPRFWLSQTDPRGRVVNAAKVGPGKRVFSPQAAYLVSHILADPMARIRGFGLRTPFRFPFPVAVKTGTSNNWRDNWTVGYTPQLTVGVWVGNFDGRPMHNVSGVSGAGPIFRDVMLAVMEGRQVRRFESDVAIVTLNTICPLSGKLAGPHCPHKMVEHYIPGTEPTESCDFHRLIPIDRRNGLLAGDDCPERHLQKSSFASYPPRYAEWVAQRHLRQAPTRFSPLCPNKHLARGSLQLLSPHPGARYLIDHTQSRTFQTLPLRVVAPRHTRSVTWIVNGKVYKRVGWPFSVRWPLAPGEHTVKVVAAGMTSKAVRIIVH